MLFGGGVCFTYHHSCRPGVVVMVEVVAVHSNNPTA